MRVLLLGLILLLLLGRWILLLLLMQIGVRVLGRVLLLRLKLLLGRELLVLLELLLVSVLLVLLRIVRIVVVVLGHLLFLLIVGNVEWIPGEWVRRKRIFDFPFLCCGCSLVLILLSVLGHASKLG